MDTPEKLAGSCAKCGKDIEVDKTYCDQCAIEMAEENIPDAEGIMPAPTRGRRKTLIQVVILLACLAVIAFQLPKVTDAFN